ncbi:MAG: zinc ribbon domain-containing protein, partial [Candidatus Thermoplasmatota archaeon]|nr:zinc ribbon domain-containing protein [Candidatus Thermoplasmatota archaeon]
MARTLNLGIENLAPPGTGVVEPGARIILRGQPGGERSLAVASFVKEGIARGEAAIAVISTSSEEFMSRLESIQVNAKEAISSGQLHIVDWERFHRTTVRGVEEFDGILAASVDLANVRMAIGMSLESSHQAGFSQTRILVDIVESALSLYNQEELQEHLLGIFARMGGATGMVVFSEDERSETTASSFQNYFDGRLQISRGSLGTTISLESLSEKTASVPEKRIYIVENGLAAEQAGIACAICGARLEKEADFCPECGADFALTPPEKTLKKVEADHTRELYLCPFCGAFIAKEASQCDICGAEFLLEEEDEGVLLEEVEEELPEMMVESPEEEQGRIETLFQKFFGVVKKKEETKPEEHNLYLCPFCGAIVSKTVRSCPLCRHDFEESSLTTLAFDDDSALLCSNCGAFLPENAKTCPICDYQLEEPYEGLDIEDEFEEMDSIIATASIEGFLESASKKKDAAPEIAEKRGLSSGRGMVNGTLLKRRGLTNGAGRTNGMVNGTGLVNGAGLINGSGLVNGNGLING